MDIKCIRRTIFSRLWRTIVATLGSRKNRQGSQEQLSERLARCSPPPGFGCGGCFPPPRGHRRRRARRLRACPFYRSGNVSGQRCEQDGKLTRDELRPRSAMVSEWTATRASRLHEDNVARVECGIATPAIRRPGRRRPCWAGTRDESRNAPTGRGRSRAAVGPGGPGAAHLGRRSERSWSTPLS